MTMFILGNDNRCVRELRARWSIRGKILRFASTDGLLWKYYELQIRILTSGRSDIEKINRKKCKIHSDENRYVPICYYKLSRDFCVKY